MCWALSVRHFNNHAVSLININRRLSLCLMDTFEAKTEKDSK